MNVRQLILACDNLSYDTTIVIRTENTWITFDYAVDVPRELMERKVARFYIAKTRTSVWLEDR